MTKMSLSVTTTESDNASIVSVIHPSPQLCTRCASFPWPSRPSHNRIFSKKIPFHETFYSLQESADHGCVLCRFAWSSIVNDCTVNNDVFRALAKGSIDLDLFISNNLLDLSARLHLEGQTLLHGAETSFEIVESEEVELLGNMKRRHIKGNHVLDMC